MSICGSCKSICTACNETVDVNAVLIRKDSHHQVVFNEEPQPVSYWDYEAKLLLAARNSSLTWVRRGNRGWGVTNNRFTIVRPKKTRFSEKVEIKNSGTLKGFKLSSATFWCLCQSSGGRHLRDPLFVVWQTDWLTDWQTEYCNSPVYVHWGLLLLLLLLI